MSIFDMADIRAYEQRIETLKEENSRLEKAVDILMESNSFYAENYNPVDYDQGLTPYDLDEGKKARQAKQKVQEILGE